MKKFPLKENDTYLYTFNVAVVKKVNERTV